MLARGGYTSLDRDRVTDGLAEALRRESCGGQVPHVRVRARLSRRFAIRRGMLGHATGGRARRETRDGLPMLNCNNPISR